MVKLKYGCEIYRKSFTADSMKKAYMMAAKWVATYIIANSELTGIAVEYEKSLNEFPSIIVHINVLVNEKDLKNRHCKMCKEFHNSFFINKSVDCSRCEAASYQKWCEKMVKPKAAYCRDILKKSEEEEQND